MTLERELKFSLMDDYFPSKLELEPHFKQAGYRVMADGTQTITDIYYDDAFNSLARAGWALRKRSQKNKVLACLKHQGSYKDAVYEREEIEAEFSGNWPIPIQSKLISITFHDLNPRLELVNDRTQYRIFKDFSHLASLSFDNVTAKEPGAKKSVSFSEAELEGSPNIKLETLKELAELIDGITPLNPNSSSKLERGLALLSLGQSL